MDDVKSFLGTGWSFPPSFSLVSGSVDMSSEEKDIEESIRIILNTIPGERVMQPEFGCDLRKMLFENTTGSFLSELNNSIYYALLKFEPRIKFDHASVISREELDGLIHIQIYYSIIITNTRHNIVFPFYYLEGTDVPPENNIYALK